MGFLQLYARVLARLGTDRRLGWLLALANIAVASALFAEPVLFGRVINVLAAAQADVESIDWTKLWTLIVAWAALGLFTILCGTLIALSADRLAHRRRLAVLTSYFEHVLQLPLAYHGETHSGRLMKIMLQGTDALWAFWLGFFREHLAAFVSLFILVPLALFLNWRMAILLIVLCVLFAALTALVSRKTETLQREVQTYHSDLAERASDALGNIALVHSFVRIVNPKWSQLKSVGDRLLAAQYPVLSWWAVATVLTRASTTLAIVSIIALGAWLFRRNLITVGEIVTFMALAGMVITRLEQAVGFANRMTISMQHAFVSSSKCSTQRPRCTTVPMRQSGRFVGRVEFDNVSFAFDGTRPTVSGLSFVALPGENADCGGHRCGKSTADVATPRLRSPIRVDQNRWRLYTRHSNFRAQTKHRRRVPGSPTVQSIDCENLRVGKPDTTDEQMRDAAARAQVLYFIEYNVEKVFYALVGERGSVCVGGERQRLSIALSAAQRLHPLFDEATSALDAATETRVLTALDEVMKIAPRSSSPTVSPRSATCRVSSCLTMAASSKWVHLTS